MPQRRVSYRVYHLPSPLNRARVPARATPDEESRKFWPSVRCDTVVTFDGTIPSPTQLASTSDCLLASLFYVEGCPRPLHSPLQLLVKCRLPSGNYLYDLMERIRRRNIQVYYAEEASVLCPEDVWRHLTEQGLPFERRLCLYSPGPVVEVKMDSLLSDVPVRLSNSPYVPKPSYGRFAAGNEHKRHIFDKIDSLVEELGSFTM